MSSYIIKLLLKSDEGQDQAEEFTSDLLDEAKEHLLEGEEVLLVGVRKVEE